MTAASTYRSDGYTAYPKNPAFSGGKHILSVPFQKTITAAAAVALDKYVLAGPLSFGDKISEIIGATPAMTSANDNDLGFFKLNADGTFSALLDSTGASAKDILWNGVDLSSALTYRELLGTLNTSLNRSKNIGQILGLGPDSEPSGGVYLLLTINTASTATTVDLKLKTMVEEATTN